MSTIMKNLSKIKEKREGEMKMKCKLKISLNFYKTTIMTDGNV